MAIPITHDSFAAWDARARKPKEVWCARCGFPYSTITPHLIAYGADGEKEKGLMILCESCHRTIERWEERWAYYLLLLEEWKGTPQDITADEKINLYMNVKMGF